MTGGESWVDESVQDGWLNCTSLDVVSLHAYSPGDYNTTFLQTYIQCAQASNKKLIMEEWSVSFLSSSFARVLISSSKGARATSTQTKITAPQVTPYPPLPATRIYRPGRARSQLQDCPGCTGRSFRTRIHTYVYVPFIKQKVYKY